MFPILTSGRPSLFNTLREQTALISSLALKEPGIPRYLWSTDYRVLSIDGFALPVTTIVSGIHAILSQTEAALDKVTRGCPLHDFWEQIDKALDLDQPRQWFMDKSRETTTGYSFITDPANDLVKYEDRLLRHLLSEDRDDFVVDIADNVQHCNKGCHLSHSLTTLLNERNYRCYLELVRGPR